MELDRRLAQDRRASQQVEEEAWLLGYPTLRKYLDNVEGSLIDKATYDREATIAEWRAGHDHFYDLEQAEAGDCENIDVREIDPSLNDLAEQVRGESRFRRAFDSVPTRFAMLELDRLIVSQPQVSVTHAIRIESRLGSAPSPEALFRCSMALDGGESSVEVRQVGSKRFLFRSPSLDFRFQESTILGGSQISGFDPYGPIGGCLGIMTGFSSNFLSVIQSENRYVLHNGHHRAYALRRMGLTHAPCVVQRVTRMDELDLVASSTIIKRANHIFSAPRPAQLKDFFNPRLSKVLPVRKLSRVVEISFEVKEFEIDDFLG